jgi:methylmalonyl-CoA mutase N-terminal domain/subunit
MRVERGESVIVGVNKYATMRRRSSRPRLLELERDQRARVRPCAQARCVEVDAR